MTAQDHVTRARRILAIVGRHKPGRRRRRLIVLATEEWRKASAALR